ncbi:hypothetical protein [Pseudodesulfovibrio sp.]|uniref:hypothetical protein n=1 Tax=unclassified Pseudodesulfovibrio TaxID=2661612 RepID=UPI003B000514
MSIKLPEVIIGELFVGAGAYEIGAGKAFIYGYPQPLWTSYLLTATGIAIPLFAWYSRRSSKGEDDK